MTSPDLMPPSPLPAIGGDDVARVEQWAARQRAELSRLSLAARSAQVKADQAERHASPEELLAVLDSMLDSAVCAADLAVQTARGDAAAIVAASHERATDHLRSLGLDPRVALGPAEWTSGAIPDCPRPASAEALWQDIEIEARAAGLTVGSEQTSGVDPDVAPGASVESTAPALERPPVDGPEPIRDVPPLGPDLELAASEPPGPTDVHSCDAPMPGATDEAEAFGDAEWFEACWGGAESGRPVRQMVPAGHAPMPEGTDETEMLGDAEWFEAAWGGAERRHPVRQMVPAGPGRPPPGHLRPDGDHPEPMRAFPSRWPDPEQAAREFPDGPTDKGTGPAPMPRRPDDARGLDDQAFEVFWRGPESVDLLWDDAENRRTIRDRLRRRAPQEQR